MTRALLLSFGALIACDGKDGEDTASAYVDADEDGFYDIAGGGTDCDDGDAQIHPRAIEVCDGVDNNCNIQIDENLLTAFFQDNDNDGVGNIDKAVEACEATDGWAATSGDCDDSNAATYPGAPEICDGRDNDCDEDIDENPVDESLWLPDADGDGFGDENAEGIISCLAPTAGYANVGGDCDDNASAVNPGGTEVCDEFDNDCDGLFNQDDPDVNPGELTTYYADFDEDGYGDVKAPSVECWQQSGQVADNSDCDDDNSSVNPGAAETCDAVDNDCDGDVDDADSNVTGQRDWYNDGDGDGYGDGVPTTQCYALKGSVAISGDCDDTEYDIHPRAEEICDEIDNDCSGEADDNATDGDPYYVDNDEDGIGGSVTIRFCGDPEPGLSTRNDDCDDYDEVTYPGANELCDGVDNDCDGVDDTDDPDVVASNLFYADTDGDTYGDPYNALAACLVPDGYVDNDGDCDDTNAEWNVSDPWYPDNDGDGYGETAGKLIACGGPSGYITTAGDCNDDDFDINPDAVEVYYDGTDSNCDGASDYDQDFDGWESDGYGGFDCDDVDGTVHPYAYEFPSDSVDNDCDGDEDSADTDVATSIALSDDDSELITFGSMSFPFCGDVFTEVYVGSNGYVTFDNPDTDFGETETEMLQDKRIAAFWTDLNPSSVGAEWIEYSDAVGVYWIDVPLFSSSASLNSFGVIMFDDGRIMIDYYGVSSDPPLIGWSCGPGGTTTDHPPADISALALSAPDLEDGLGQGTEEAVYERFTGTSPLDVDNRSLRFCVQSGTDGDADGWTDSCGDPNDSDPFVVP